MVESQEKVSEKSGNFEMDIEWQPCVKYQFSCNLAGFLDILN